MNLSITGHHLEITPALREYVQGKLMRVRRHFDQVMEANVVLGIEHAKQKDARQKAECTLRVKGQDFFAEAVDADLYAAIDELTDKLDRQVTHYKSRIQDHHHPEARHHNQG